jgi:uncharacterized protein (DUF2267 family)
MDELIASVVEKTSLDEEEAAVVVKLVLDFIKDKLPAPVGAQIDNLLDGEGGLGGAADMLGGLFGKK